MSSHFLMDIAVILLFTKFFGLITRKFNMPQVLGALIAGLLLGPTGLGILRETEFIASMAELGVVVLMFVAGLETDFHELKKSGKASLIIAVLGVLVPLTGGFLVAGLVNANLWENLFIGVVLTATSVSITVETLQEMGKLKTSSGTAILGAAIIDDIIGIVILTIITSLRKPDSPAVGIVLLKLLGFFVLALVSGVVFYYFFQWLCEREGKKRRVPVFAFAFALVLAFVAETFGIADITGAYIAGLILSNTINAHYIEEKLQVISFMLLSPIFFADIGIKTDIGGMSAPVLVFTVLLVLVAILSKVIGCGLGARVCGYTRQESMRIGTGMVSRGEVALIVANKGTIVGLMPNVFFAPVIIVVIVTTLITPILLRFVYGSSEDFTAVAGLEKHAERSGLR